MFKDQLKNHLSKFSTAPFLFIGSGMSRRYIGMETWIALLKRIHENLGLNKPFAYYESNSEDLPALASFMGSEFNELWWTDELFKDSRNVYQEFAKTKYSPLKFEITNYIKNKGIKIEYLQEEIDLFKNVKVDGILTTNWDELLESLFPDFKKFVGQEEMIFAETLNVAEIYKVHGCVSNPESLILTSEDYADFNERNPYLAAKLLTIFMEHPIIFLGYSLDDLNIQQIFKNIIKCLTRSNISKLTDRLIFCQWDINQEEPIILDSTLMITDTIIPIKLIRCASYLDLYSVLGDLQKKIPVRVLRQMKEMIYEFVRENEPKSKIYVSDNLDQLSSEDVEFVYGVGIKDKLGTLGIKGIDARALLRDVIIDQKWNPIQISEMLLPALKNQFVPYFKYLRNGDFLNEEGLLVNENPCFDQSFKDHVNSITPAHFYPRGSYLTKKDEVNQAYNSFKELLEGEKDFVRKLLFATMLDPAKINLTDLWGFLKINLDSLIHSYHGTHFRKLICLYDYLQYKSQDTKNQLHRF